jgi:hypothetical protein
LRSIGEMKFSLGGNPDSTSVTIENVSQSLGVALTDTERSLDGASIIIKRAFLVDVDTNEYEADVLFSGVVDGVKVDENVVSLMVVSDISQRGARIGNIQVTQRCRHVFKDAHCAWIEAQGGDPDFCNKVFDSEEGCLGHNNQFHFGGVPTLLAREIPPQQYPPGTGPGGWEPVPTNFPTKFDPDYQPWLDYPL